jgi:hypothetical protein
MRSPWSCLALAWALFVPGPVAIADPAKDEGVSWTARPDPLPYKMPASVAADKTISLGKTGAVIYPSTTSPFACVLVPGGSKQPPELRLIDLGRLEQVGQSLKVEGITAAGLRVSPFGDAVAAVDDTAERPAVKVWTFDGKAPRSVVVHDSKLAVEALDFAGRGKLLTVKEIRDVKANHFERLWEVWDIDTGKRLSSFQYQLEYGPGWVDFSPGRNYLAMEHSTNDGYHFLIWDLATGKLAGKLEVQPRKEGFGVPGGITFSPDGNEAALLWQQGGDGMFAKIHRFDIEKGVKKGEHLLREEIKPSAVGFGVGGMTTIQFLPDGRGWLISGHQIVARETGKVAGKVGAAPGYKNNVHDRRFVDAYHVTTLGDRKFGEKKLSHIALPKAELDAELQKTAPK